MKVHLIAYGKFDGQTYAFDFVSDEKEAILRKRLEFREKVQERKLESLFTLHQIVSDGEDFDSIRNFDPYFEKAKELKNFDDFLKLADKKSTLTSVDVASYLVRKYDLAPFALQKTLYYIYSDLLAFHKFQPFKAQFVAFKDGPVDQDVYRENKHYKSRLLQSTEFERKIYAIKDKDLILSKIHDIVDKHAVYFDKIWRDGEADNPQKNYTHRDETPWSRAFGQGEERNSPIDDVDIIMFHKNEVVF